MADGDTGSISGQELDSVANADSVPGNVDDSITPYDDSLADTHFPMFNHSRFHRPYGDLDDGVGGTEEWYNRLDADEPWWKRGFWNPAHWSWESSLSALARRYSLHCCWQSIASSRLPSSS